MKLEKRYWREYDEYEEWLKDILRENDSLQERNNQLEICKEQDEKRSSCTKEEVNDLILESHNYRLQLKIFKDKENKLREYLVEEDIFKPNMDSHKIEDDYIKCNNDILQILNEGQDENY